MYHINILFHIYIYKYSNIYTYIFYLFIFWFLIYSALVVIAAAHQLCSVLKCLCGMTLLTNLFKLFLLDFCHYYALPSRNWSPIESRNFIFNKRIYICQVCWLFVTLQFLTVSCYFCFPLFRFSALFCVSLLCA